MSVLQQLASAQGERGEAANVRLAEAVAKSGDRGAVRELAEQLETGSRATRNDSMKVLYEIGARAPAMIRAVAPRFVAALSHTDNRVIWGAMTALDAIAEQFPEDIPPHLAKIVAAARAGSVITRDHAIGILIKLVAIPRIRTKCMRWIVEMIETAGAGQVGMYAEMASGLLPAKDGGPLRRVLEERLTELPKESQRKRVKKVLDRAAKTMASAADGRPKPRSKK